MADNGGDRLTYGTLTRRVRAVLAEALPAGEADWAARMIMEGLTGRSRTDLIVRAGEEPLAATAAAALATAGRVAAGEPVQYVLGFEQFMGLRIGVGPGVLIPRRETEELCQLIVDREKGRADLPVLDLYSGSGCLALALSRWLPFAQVTALELSPAALDAARRNASALKARIAFVEADALTWEPPREAFDIVTANPPYVLESERAAMEPVVLDHEPAMALFVPDAEPLLHYRAAARIAARGLRPGGRLYLEINPLQAEPLRRLLGAGGFADTDILRDSSGRLRFATAKKA